MFQVFPSNIHLSPEHHIRIMISSSATSLEPFYSMFPKMIWYAVLGLTLLILELNFQSHHFTFHLQVKPPRIHCPYHRFIFHKGSKLKKIEMQRTWSAILVISSLSFGLEEQLQKPQVLVFFSILFKLPLNLIGKLHHLCWNQSVQGTLNMYWTLYTCNTYVWKQNATNRNHCSSKRGIILKYFLSNSRQRDFIEPSVGSEKSSLSETKQCTSISSQSIYNSTRTQVTHEGKHLDHRKTVRSLLWGNRTLLIFQFKIASRCFSLLIGLNHKLFWCWNLAECTSSREVPTSSGKSS